MKNELARELSLAEGKIQYDNSVKRVLANKRILAWILKYVTEEFAIPMENKEIGEELNQMCNLSDYVEELGIQKGLEQGKERLLRLQIEKKLAKGLSLPEIADALEEKEETIRKIIGAIKHTTE